MEERSKLGSCQILFIAFLCVLLAAPSCARDRIKLREDVRQMFYHAYDNYMQFAFPHDELKPLSRSYTDSLAELGNLKHEHLPEEYNGTALTLVESLSRWHSINRFKALKNFEVVSNTQKSSSWKLSEIPKVCGFSGCKLSRVGK